MQTPGNIAEPLDYGDGQASHWRRRLRPFVLRTLIVFGVLVLPFGPSAVAQRGDSFEGAVWKFSMTPKVPRKEPMRGLFRVNNYEVFQKEKPDDETFSLQVGKIEPKGNRTRIMFHDARAFERPSGSGPGSKPGPGSRPGSRTDSGDGQLGAGPGRAKELKGVAALKMEKFGEWSGLFTDSEGNHWDFRCSRIQE